MSGIKWLWTFPHTAWAASAISISNSRPRSARFSQASGFLSISSGEESLCNGRRLYPHESPAPLARLLGVTLRWGGAAGILALLFHFLPLGPLSASLHRVPPASWLFV